MNQTVEAERWWWDALTDQEIPENVADLSVAPTDGCLTEIFAALTPIREGARLLDLGCGPGRLAIPLARGCPWSHVVGVDISRTMLAVARRGRERHGLRNLVLLLGDGRTLPPLAGALDGAYSMLVFQHLPAAACAGYVQEVAERLKPGGRFVYQVVIGKSDDSFLSHQCRSIEEPLGWAWDAGLKVTDSHRSSLYDAWAWIVAVKP